MSNYTKSTNFAAKDALASGNAAKIVKGTEIDTEFNNIATAIATKADANGGTFLGTVNFDSIDASGTITATDVVADSVTSAVTGNVTGNLTGNVTGNVSGSSGSVATTNWTITEVSGELVFKYGGAVKAKLNSSGDFTVIGEITAYGTM
jgi:hypothetical protein